jgi:hypothetical protein
MGPMRARARGHTVASTTTVWFDISNLKEETRVRTFILSAFLFKSNTQALYIYI